MTAAVSVDVSLSWWVGLYSPKDSKDLIWNTTKQIQGLVESWAEETPSQTSVGKQDCVGFNISGSLHTTDCTGQGLYHPICMFGEN